MVRSRSIYISSLVLEGAWLDYLSLHGGKFTRASSRVRDIILDMPRVGFRTITFVMCPCVVGTILLLLHPFSGSNAYQAFRLNLEFY